MELSYETDFSPPTEPTFVLVRNQGDGRGRLERKLRQSQINVERLSLMFKVSVYYTVQQYDI